MGTAVATLAMARQFPLFLFLSLLACHRPSGGFWSPDVWGNHNSRGINFLRIAFFTTTSLGGLTLVFSFLFNFCKRIQRWIDREADMQIWRQTKRLIDRWMTSSQKCWCVDRQTQNATKTNFVWEAPFVPNFLNLRSIIWSFRDASGIPLAVRKGRARRKVSQPSPSERPGLWMNHKVSAVAMIILPLW